MQAQIGSTYEADDTGNQYEVVDVHGDRHSENATVELSPVDGGEWHTQYLDNFRTNYSKVVGDESSLTDGERDEIKGRASESWSRLASEFGVSEDAIRSVIIA